MNLKLLQSPSSTTGYSGPAHAEWKWLTSVASPFVVREEDLGQPREVACTPAHIQRAEKQTWYYKAAGGKKNEFLHCQAVHDNGFGEVVSAQAVHCSKAWLS